MHEYILSDSGVKVWTSPDNHPLLKDTDLAHPAFQDKLTETYSRGKVRGIPRILSRNSEDALTWVNFSHLLTDVNRRSEVLGGLFRLAMSEEQAGGLVPFIQLAEVALWPKLKPPDTRTLREGPTEPDLVITLGRSIILVEAKYKSGVSKKTTYDRERDQVIRLLDVGSWHAKLKRLEDTYVIVLVYGEAETNAQEIVGKYRCNPAAIQSALPYREDLTEAHFQRLAESVSFVRWPDPWNEQPENQ